MTMPGRGSSDEQSAATPDNPTGRIRIEAEGYTDSNGVTIFNSDDVGGGSHVEADQNGEWMAYSVNAPIAGTYVLNFRLRNAYGPSQLQIRNSNDAVLGTITVSNTGSNTYYYNTFTTTVSLPAGQQILKLYCLQNSWTLNWWELVPPRTASGSNTNTSTYHVEAEDFITQNNIATENCQDAGGSLNTVYSNQGAWADYRVAVPISGTYTVKLRVGNNGYGILKLRNAGGTDLATVNLPATGGLQTYSTVTANVSLSGGTQTLRVYCEGPTFTVNWLEIVTPPGLTNYALTLNQSSSNGANSLVYDAENNFTMEFWVKPSGTHEVDSEGNSGTDGLSGQRYVIYPSSGGDGYGSRAGIGVSVGTNGVSVYEHADNHMPATLVWASPTPLSDWTHVAVVYNNRLATLYINGDSVRTGVLSGRNHLYPSSSFPGGYYGSASSSQLDEVRIWKVARSQAEIQEHMNGEIAATSTGLVGYWPMNEGSGTVLHDVSGNGRDIDLSTAGYNSGNTNWTIGRNISTNQADKYRYAFNGKEDDKDISEGAQDYGMRIYDNRIAKFLSVDPLQKKYPELTPYQFASNTPIQAIDQDGLEAAYVFGTAEYMAGVVGQEVTLGLAIDSKGIALAGSFGGKIGIGASVSAGVGLVVFPTMNDMHDMEGRGESISFSGAFLGKFGVGAARSSGKWGMQGSVGVGLGGQLSYGVSATVMSRTITWEELGDAAKRIPTEPDLMIEGINVKVLFSLYNLKQNSSVQEMSSAFFGQYKPLIVSAIDQSIAQRQSNNDVMNQQVVANNKTIQEIDSDKNASILQRTKSLLLKGANTLMQEKVKQNDKEIQNLENKKKDLTGTGATN